MAFMPSPFAELIAKLGVPADAERAEFGPKIITALVSMDEYKASRFAKEFLVAQVEAMVLADRPSNSTSLDLAHSVELDGFLTLRRLEGLRTPAAWLHYELTPILGEAGTVEFMDMTEYLLTLQFEPTRIDKWLIDNFFESHIRTSKTDPKIAHVVSPEGTIQLLVPTQNITRERISEIVERVVVQSFNENRRFREAMKTRFDFEAAAEFEAKMYDAQQFQEKVTQLITENRTGPIGMHLLSREGLLALELDFEIEIDIDVHQPETAS